MDRNGGGSLCRKYDLACIVLGNVAVVDAVESGSAAVAVAVAPAAAAARVFAV